MFSIATWNINSVRLRQPLVERLLAEVKPDVLCLQEIKCTEDQFPRAAFEKAGYGHIAIHGQVGYHGVATLSRHPFAAVEREHFAGKTDARHIRTVTEHGGRALSIDNFYIPAGGDVPDPEENEKFAHKLRFIEELTEWGKARQREVDRVLVGDLNIAPHPDDVWSHKQLLKVVSHTPVETEGLLAAQAAGAWADVVRAYIPPPEKLYTWWSYRARDWAASDRGRRLDHIWVDEGLAARHAAASVLRDARGWEKPSDHVPIIAYFEI